MVTGRALQLTRGLSVAVVGVALPLASHVGAGGTAAVSAMTLLVLGFVAAVTVLVSAREWTVMRLTATLLPIQALVHLTLTSGAGAGHGASHQVVAASTAGSGMPEAAGGAGSAMLVGHTAALVLVVLWLRGAERALLWFAALLRRLFVRAEPLTFARLANPRYAASPGLQLPLPHGRSADSRAPPILSFT